MVVLGNKINLYTDVGLHLFNTRCDCQLINSYSFLLEVNLLYFLMNKLVIITCTY